MRGNTVQRILGLLLVAWALPVLAHGPYAPPDRNVTLLGHLDAYGGYSNIWGYTTPDGREWALLGTTTGLSIVDATAPSALFEVAFIPGPPSSWREIRTWSHHAYIVTEGAGAGAGMQIVDLDALPVPQLVRTHATGFTTAHTLFIDEAGRAYVNGTANGMHVLSLADPEQPVEVGLFSAPYVHDIYVRGGIGYAAEIYRGALEVLDLSAPAGITSRGAATYFGAVTHNTWLTDDGRYVLSTDETTGGGVRVWDAADPAALAQVAHYQRSAEQSAHNVHVRGSLAFVSHYVEGVRVLDLADPRFPSEVGGYDTYLFEHDGAVAFHGAWGVFPYTSSGRFYVSDIESGLYVFSFSPDYGAVGGIVRDAGTLLPLEGVRASVAGGEEVESFADGAYRLTAPPGPRTLRFEKFGYEPAAPAVASAAGPALALDVLLARVPSGSLEGTVAAQGTGAPIPGAQVSLPGTPLAAIAGPGGEFVVDPVPEGYHEVRVDAPGRTPVVVGVEVVEGSASVVPLVMPLALAHLDMESDPGWSVGAAGDAATTGIWVRTDPNGTQGNAVNPEDDATPGPGALAWVTGNGPIGGSAGANDVDNGTTTLTSDPIPVGIGPVPTRVSYQRWYSNEAGGNIDDLLRVRVSGDDGASWNDLETLSVSAVPWQEASFNASAYAPPGGAVRLRFVAADLGLGSIVEAGVDEVRAIQTCQTRVNPLLPDADADGVGDPCDACPLDPFDDRDGDGLCGDVDNAPATPNVLQEDGDGDAIGDAIDNCPTAANPDQRNGDADLSGNACDADDDGDGVPDGSDVDQDGDGVANGADRCPDVRDPEQRDLDLDGEGDACDPDDGLVSGVRLDPAGGIAWEPEAGVEAYRVRRGDRGRSETLDLATTFCLVPATSVAAALDRARPARGRWYFYLVTSLTAGTEGPAGVSSLGAARITSPCP